MGRDRERPGLAGGEGGETRAREGGQNLDEEKMMDNGQAMMTPRATGPGDAAQRPSNARPGKEARTCLSSVSLLFWRGAAPCAHVQQQYAVVTQWCPQRRRALDCVLCEKRRGTDPSQGTRGVLVLGSNPEGTA